jgi:DNA-binding response OmpR family regulator
MANEKILIVEDEKDLVKLLRYNLEKEGYQVVSATDGEAALEAFKKEKPDFVILDWMLPKLDGMQVCRMLRAQSKTPILMLTAKKEEMDRVLGLEMGADDYLTKPFSVRELMVRIKTILRRSQPDASSEKTILRFGVLEVDLERYVVSLKGKPIELSSKEFDFLKTLLQSGGKVLTRDQLLEKVWGIENSYEIDTRTVDQHIARLRNKLGPESDRVITVKNVGYRFKTEN